MKEETAVGVAVAISVVIWLVGAALSVALWGAVVYILGHLAGAW